MILIIPVLDIGSGRVTANVYELLVLIIFGRLDTVKVRVDGRGVRVAVPVWTIVPPFIILTWMDAGRVELGVV